MEFDILLLGGEVVDGTGALPRRADVGVRGGVVEALGDLAAATAATVLDASDHYLTPGFVDVHAHTDLVAFFAPELADVAAAGVRQGVTTEVPGNCGSSPWPGRRGGVADPYLQAMPPSARRTFDSLADFREAADAQGSLFANLAPLLGHGSVRSAVVGDDRRGPTAHELAEMRRVVARAMDEGAFGLSSGLIYAPGMYADLDELAALATEAGRHDRPYTTHMRDEGDRVHLALEEALEIGRRSGAPVQVSHHKLSGRRNWGRSAQTLAMIDEARRGGQDVLIDVYPYTAGSTLLGALLPPWALDGGFSTARAVLSEPSGLDRLRAEYADDASPWQNFPALIGWDRVVLAGTGPDAGRSLAEIAGGRGVDEVDALAQLLLADPGSICLVHAMDPAEVELLGDQPFSVVGSDGIALPGHQHPRLAGTFARVLARAAGDPARFADVVHRASGLPARRFGLAGRGELRKGAVADLVVVDPRSVKDNATYERPLLAPSGIPHVLVAGHQVVRAGVLTDARPGRVLSAA